MIQPVQFIATSAEQAAAACSGGVKWIQLRLKQVDYAHYKTIALAVQKVCKQYEAVFIIDDNVELAFDIKADGVHIGKEDMPITDARKLLGNDYIIGCTANTLGDTINLADSTANYIGLGPFRFTTTKQKLSPILGIEGYRTIFKELKAKGINAPPVIGIGGIQVEDIVPLLQTGLYGIAVAGAIAKEKNMLNAAQRIMQECQKIISVNTF